MSRCIGREFEIIENAKQALLDSTNIITSPKEMDCLNDILFRCWQMGWLDKCDGNKDVVEVVRCKDCKHKVVTESGEYNPEDIVCDYWQSDGLTENDFCSQGKE